MTERRLVWSTIGSLVIFNLLRGVGAFGSLADWVELVLALFLTVLALRTVLSLADVGLELRTLRSGLLWGGVAFAVVLTVVVIVAVLPGTSDFLHDDRADVSFLALIVDLVFSIGVLTVIPEELLFRGVLLGASMRRWGLRVGIVLSSGLFGLWHVFPTLSTAGGNEQFSQAESTVFGQLGLVVGAVLVTGVAGLLFSWLRVRSGSLVAPMIAHLSTNGVALSVAWVVAH